MDITYAGAAIVAAARIVVWALIVFVLIPRLIQRRRATSGRAGGVVENVVQMAFVSIVVANALVLLRLFDQFSLGVSIVGVYTARALLARHISVRAVVRAAWERLVVVTLDAIEAMDAVRTGLGSRARQLARGAWERLPRGQELAWTTLCAGAISSYAVFRMFDAVVHPASDVPSYLEQLAELKGLGSSRPAVGTTAALWVLEVLQRFSQVDPALVLRVTPALLGILDMALLMWAGSRLGGGRAGALLGGSAFALAGVTGWLPVAVGRGGDPITVSLAIAVTIPLLVLAVESVAVGGGRLVVLPGMALLTFVWPVAGALASGAVLLAVMALQASFSAREGPSAPSGRVSLSVLAQAAGGYVAGLGLATVATLATLRSGSGRLELPELDVLLGRDSALLNGTLSESRVTVLATTCLVAALLVVLMPSPPGESLRTTAARRGVGTALLGLSMLLDPSRLQLPVLLPSAAVEPFAVTVLCATLGLAFVLAAGWSRRAMTWGVPVAWRLRLGDQSGSVEIGAAVCVLALLFMLLGPVSVPSAARVQSDAEVSYLYDVAAELQPFQWTLVSDPEALAQVQGRGFFIERQQFLSTYDPRSWRFDPRRPELSVPTPYVVVLVTERTSAEDRAAVLAWMARYSAEHPGSPPVVASPRDGVIAYRLHRSAEEEARILEEVRLSEQATGP